MIDYTKALPAHTEKYLGVHDLFLEIYKGEGEHNLSHPVTASLPGRPPLLFIHGAYTGSWMWSKFIPHFCQAGWTCYVMNLRSHYKCRQLDLTRVTFGDYLADIREVLAECAVPPVLIGFSMGGILSQKLAETEELAGMVLIDSSISREVHEAVPYQHLERFVPGIVMPAPARAELSSIDESSDDIAFQRKYLGMESALAYSAFSFAAYSEGVSINSAAITCPGLVIQAVQSAEDDRRGLAMAQQLHADYTALWNTTHTGVLVGQRYKETVDAVLDWLSSFQAS
ncbi:alpha/beta fold hydrolase [Paenibacillus tengchongensis]|uniref:alpha/beta fold hydrolase n=1 Tax=Paenibacillus tengchongensis TaxID=2608684 RepID=UPI00124DC9ED|nr:alpha/beta hydrolase [Paenibacillus tengchongensis]